MPRSPMAGDEARDNIATMLRETAVAARRRLVALALDIGNLSPAARAVYAAALRDAAFTGRN